MVPGRILSNGGNFTCCLVQARQLGRQLGSGSYGTVEEVKPYHRRIIIYMYMYYLNIMYCNDVHESCIQLEVNGLVCARKKIHESLLKVGNIGVEQVVAKYMQGCQLMSENCHPDIRYTLFLGTCLIPKCQLPLLVMEKLDGSLDDVPQSVPHIPLSLKQSMLEDVARGLLCLHMHNPPVIHKDLTAKNVLLTSAFRTNSTDLGNSWIVDLQPGQPTQTLSQNPGTLVYTCTPPKELNASA